jgi:hypothetical protein
MDGEPILQTPRPVLRRRLPGDEALVQMVRRRAVGRDAGVR